MHSQQKHHCLTLWWKFKNCFLFLLAEDKPNSSKTLAKDFDIGFGICDSKMEHREQDFGLLIYVALKNRCMFEPMFQYWPGDTRALSDRKLGRQEDEH